MPQQTIKFTIKQDGSVTEEVIGIVGNDCENLTKRVEERLGVVQNVEHKPEYYQQQVTIEENVPLHEHKD
tara:strand:- start:414 stop:623 length:210 start_codon:yes stop_codon:yes gene_type:complete